MSKQEKPKFTTLLEICRTPSVTGEFDIVFTIVATDDAEKFISISKMRGEFAFGGIVMPLDKPSIDTLVEMFFNIQEGMEALEKETVKA